MKLIIGFNGFIRVGEHVQVRDPGMMDNHKDDEMISSSSTKEQSHTPLETPQSICRMGNGEWGMRYASYLTLASR